MNRRLPTPPIERSGPPLQVRAGLTGSSGRYSRPQSTWRCGYGVYWVMTHILQQGAALAPEKPLAQGIASIPGVLGEIPSSRSNPAEREVARGIATVSDQGAQYTGKNVMMGVWVIEQLRSLFQAPKTRPSPLSSTTEYSNEKAVAQAAAGCTRYACDEHVERTHRKQKKVEAHADSVSKHWEPMSRELGVGRWTGRGNFRGTGGCEGFGIRYRGADESRASELVWTTAAADPLAGGAACRAVGSPDDGACQNE